MRFFQEHCNEQQWTQIQDFVETVRSANLHVNLVSRKDIDNVMEHHVMPCFTYKWLNRIHPAQHILDIGSGGGFPGIINAILFPDSEFVLVESTKKKVDFLTAVIDQLELPNIHAVWSRVEDLPLDEYGETFDMVTCRGVASLAQLIDWSTPYVKPDGTLEALKGLDAEQEAEHIQLPIELLTLPETMQMNDRLKNLRLAVVML